MLLTYALLLACSHPVVVQAPSGSEPITITLDQIITPGSERSFVSHNSLDGGALWSNATTHRLLPVPELLGDDPPAGLLLDGTMVQVEGGEQVIETHMGYLLGPDGLQVVATWKDGVWTVEPDPMLDLPVRITLGDSWQAEGSLGGKPGSRSCTATVTPFCADGLAMECHTRSSDATLWNRKHYCPGSGWAGQELVVLRDDGHSLEVYSTDLVVNGQPGPEVPMSARPMPKPGELGGR